MYIIIFLFPDEWKKVNIQQALEALSTHCTELRGLSLGGWNGLNPDHLKFLTAECTKLERIDLSAINVIYPDYSVDQHLRY